MICTNKKTKYKKTGSESGSGSVFFAGEPANIDIYRKPNVWISAMYNSTLLENQILSLAIEKARKSKHDTKDPDCYTANIRIKELPGYHSGLGGYYYRKVKDATARLENQFILAEDPETKVINSIDIIKTALYDSREGITVSFAPGISVPEIMTPVRNYTLIPQGIMQSFRSNYSLRLYENLKMHTYSRYLSHSSKGKVYRVSCSIAILKMILGTVNAEAVRDRLKDGDDLEDVETIVKELETEEIKGSKRTDKKCKYLNIRDFKRNVLRPAIREINAISDISVTYAPDTSGPGGKIYGITFEITKKKQEIKEDKEENAPEESVLMDMVNEMDSYLLNAMSVKDKKLILKEAGYNMDIIEEKCELMHNAGEIRSQTAWLISAIRKDYKPSEDVAEMPVPDNAGSNNDSPADYARKRNNVRNQTVDYAGDYIEGYEGDRVEDYAEDHIKNYVIDNVRGNTVDALDVLDVLDTGDTSMSSPADPSAAQAYSVISGAKKPSKTSADNKPSGIPNIVSISNYRNGTSSRRKSGDTVNNYKSPSYIDKSVKESVNETPEPGRLNAPDLTIDPEPDFASDPVSYIASDPAFDNDETTTDSQRVNSAYSTDEVPGQMGQPLKPGETANNNNNPDGDPDMNLDKDLAKDPKQPSGNKVFDSLWEAYPCKTNKNRVTLSHKKAIEKIGMSLMQRALTRYLSEVASDRMGGFQRQYQSGGRFFTEGFKEYLSDDYSRPSASYQNANMYSQNAYRNPYKKNMFDGMITQDVDYDQIAMEKARKLMDRWQSSHQLD